MIGKQVISRENVPLYAVNEVLAERSKDGELNYEQQQAFEYSKKFSKITPAKGEKLLKELREIEGLSEDFITKAVDILPLDVNAARLISGKDMGIDNAKLEQVVAATSKYAK